MVPFCRESDGCYICKNGYNLYSYNQNRHYSKELDEFSFGCPRCRGSNEEESVGWPPVFLADWITGGAEDDCFLPGILNKFERFY